MKELAEKIKQRFEKLDNDVVVKTTTHKLSVTIDGWTYYLSLNDEPYVQIESQEIARMFAQNRLDQQQIACTRQRLETFGEIDIELEYVNEVLFILEIIQTDYRGILFDPDRGEFFG
jgi:hypothetical protein